jgi:WD40 repeat protein/serine/threonine protein kinase
MSDALSCDEDLVRRLPLPLAQLYRRAHNAKTPLERHLTAFYLWEAALKLLGSAAVAAYARQGPADPELTERLQNLARPTLGHWWEFVRRLVPVLAEAGHEGFAQVRELLLGRSRADFPRAAGLDAALRQALEGKPGARAAVRLAELFDRLVQYRNTVLAHAAPGQLGDDFHERLGGALLAGVAEVLGRLDVRAGRRLLYVAEVRQAAGAWLVLRYELIGEGARRLPSLEVPRAEAARLPDAERVYLLGPPRPPSGSDPGGEGELLPLHPLLIYDAEAGEALFLNARRGRRRTEYLCYTTGRTADRPDLGTEQRELLARVLGLAVAEEQAEQWAARSQAEDLPRDAPDAPARRLLGEFELLSELGRGGMGVVYRAWQPSLGRQVALKRLLATGDARTEARFRREIRALGRVEHPNLVKVFTSGADGDQWFYAMELVEGAPLSAVCSRLQASGSRVTDLDARTWQEALRTVCEQARLAEKPLSGSPPEATPPARPPAEGRPGRGYVGQVVELVRQAAEAAHALHEAGVVHRDIKAGNILVTAGGTQAVLMDLGLAQLADDAEGRLTRTRQFVGTLRYASPEQVLAAGSLDRRTDVYSLGATLWELLALGPLFGATEQTPTPELMRRIQYEEPGRIRKHHPGIARDLEAVILKCLEKDPNRRYATARALAEDLGRFLAGEPVRARPVGAWGRAVRWVRRRPAAAAFTGLVLLTALLGVAGVFWQWRRAERERERTAAALAGAEVLLYRTGVALADREWQEGNVPRAEELLDQCQAGLRRWEWYYLKRRCRGALLTLAGGDAVAFSPDGRLLALGAADDVRVVTAATGREVTRLHGHSSRVTGLSFAPRGAGGQRLASSSDDGTVRLWDVAGRRLLHTCRGHSGAVRAVAFAPDGKSLVSGGEDGIRVWDARGRRLRDLAGHEGTVTGLAFAPNGRLASAGLDCGVRLWDLAARDPRRALLRHPAPVRAVAFHPAGRQVASACADRAVRLWDLDTGRPVHTWRDFRGEIDCLAFSPDGRLLAAGGGALGQPGELAVWDPAGGRPRRSLRGHAGAVLAVAFHPDGRRLAAAEAERVRVWDATQDQEARVLEGRPTPATAVAFSPDGSRLAAAGADGGLAVWAVAGGRPLAVLRGHAGNANAVAWSPDGRTLATGGEDGTVRLWDVAEGVPRPPCRTLHGHADGVWAVAWSPDGALLASAGKDGRVVLWDAGGRELARLQGHTSQVTSVAFRPDGRLLASGGHDRTVRLWDVAGRRAVRTLHGHLTPVSALAWSPDGRALASAGGDQRRGEIRLWDPEAGTGTPWPRSHAARVMGLAFHPDGGRLVSGGLDRVLKVWDVAAAREVLTLRGHGDVVLGVAFSGDGRRVASASADTTVRVWEGR